VGGWGEFGSSLLPPHKWYPIWGHHVHKIWWYCKRNLLLTRTL